MALIKVLVDKFPKGEMSPEMREYWRTKDNGAAVRFIEYPRKPTVTAPDTGRE